MSHQVNVPPAINIETLKRVVDVILDRMIADLGVREVCIEYDDDFYWNVPADDLNPNKIASPTLDVGRLSDDLEFLQGIVEDRERAVSLMLIHVAPLLRFIGERVGQ